MPAALIDGDTGHGKLRVREGAHGHGHRIIVPFLGMKHRGAADRAKSKLEFRALITGAHELRRLARDLVGCGKTGERREDAAGCPSTSILSWPQTQEAVRFGIQHLSKDVSRAVAARGDPDRIRGRRLRQRIDGAATPGLSAVQTWRKFKPRALLARCSAPISRPTVPRCRARCPTSAASSPRSTRNAPHDATFRGPVPRPYVLQPALARGR